MVVGDSQVNDAIWPFLGVWSLDLFIAVNLAGAAIWYLWAVNRVKKHGRWPGWMTTCFLLGIALLALAYLGPMSAWSHTFFWVHMTQHLIVMMAAAPCSFSVRQLLWPSWPVARRLDAAGPCQFCEVESFEY